MSPKLAGGGVPVKVELGAPVVLSPTSLELWHVPAPLRGTGRFGSILEELNAGRLAPLQAWALCGLEGAVFVYGGYICERRLCPVCSATAPAVLERPAPDPVVEHGARPS